MIVLSQFLDLLLHLGLYLVRRLARLPCVDLGPHLIQLTLHLFVEGLFPLAVYSVAVSGTSLDSILKSSAVSLPSVSAATPADQ